MNKDSKIYVAGHRGLVGSAIWNNLLAKGYTNLVGRTHKELDLLDAMAVKNFFDEQKPEYVILAAAQVGGIVANNVYRADFIFNNLQIQQNVIGESFRIGVAKLLFLGSTCIYPREAPQPMSEDSLLTSALEYTNEPYAIAKIAGLKMCESFNLQYGTNFIAVMPTNLYGPNDNFDLERSHVLPAMIRKVHLAKALHEECWGMIDTDLNNRPIEGVTGGDSIEVKIAMLAKYGIFKSYVELWGSGKPTREFMWSEEMADACVFVMESINFSDLKSYAIERGCSASQVKNCHVNIGTGEEVTIAELSQLVVSAVGYMGEVRFNSDKPDGAMRKLTDSSKLHSLGWSHKVDIKSGVVRLYDWYRS